jgi:hypothetical protein
MRPAFAECQNILNEFPKASERGRRTQCTSPTHPFHNRRERRTDRGESPHIREHYLFNTTPRRLLTLQVKLCV